MYNRRFTPEIVTSLNKNEIIVFGTNPEGNHSSRAALYAVNNCGAKGSLAGSLLVELNGFTLGFKGFG